VTGVQTCALPIYGWEFDVRTGQSFVDPARTRVRTYPVELVPGPYRAETYEVTLEGDLVLVELDAREPRSHDAVVPVQVGRREQGLQDEADADDGEVQAWPLRRPAPEDQEDGH